MALIFVPKIQIEGSDMIRHLIGAEVPVRVEVWNSDWMPGSPIPVESVAIHSSCVCVC